MEIQSKNNKEIFVSTTFFPDQSLLSDCLRVCKENKISNIEIGSNHRYQKDYSYISNYNFNYIVHNYFPVPKKKIIVNIASVNDKIYEESIQHIKNSILFSKKIGSPLYTFHPGFLSDPRSENNSNDNYDFVWTEKQKINNYDIAWQRMIKAINEIIQFSKVNNIKVAFETEGSTTKSKFLLLQRPEEYENIIKLYKPEELGISLNIGHLNLARKSFRFSIKNFLNLIQNYVVAMELSHNNGVEDQHLPLLDKNCWYWDIIIDKRFKKVKKILEYRNIDISQVTESIRLLEKKIYGI